MRIEQTFGTAAIPDAVRLIVQETDVLPLGPDDYARLITVEIAWTQAGRSVSARIARDIFDPARILDLWINRRTMPVTFRATDAGDSASVRDLLLELTQTYAPQFSAAVEEGLSAERWHHVDYFSGLPVQAVPLPRLEGMTFERFTAERERFGQSDQLLLTLHNGERGLMWLQPDAPHHLVGIKLADGRSLEVPLNWFVAIAGRTPNNWPRNLREVQQFCICTYERQFGRNGLCTRCGYEIQLSFAPQKTSGGRV